MLGSNLLLSLTLHKFWTCPGNLAEATLVVTKPGLAPELCDFCPMPSGQAERFQPRSGRSVWSGLDLESTQT